MSETNTLIQLKIAPAAFTAELISSIPDGKVGWSSDEHYDLVKRLLGALKDEGGDPATITPNLANIIRLIYQPKEDVEREVMRQAFADAGYQLDEAAEKIFIMMFSGPQFADFLAKTTRPNSAEKFIQKEKRRGAKKDTLNSLLAAATTPAPVGDESAASETDEQRQEETETAPKPVKKGSTTK